jgi:hypothetical protein
MAYPLSHKTPLTNIQHGASPYRDINAGGKWACGNNTRWGSLLSREYNQDCAACNPCTDDRMAVRNAVRDTWVGGCCNGETYDTLSAEPQRWPWRDDVASRSLTGAAVAMLPPSKHAQSYLLPLTEKYAGTSLAELGSPAPTYFLAR